MNANEIYGMQLRINGLARRLSPLAIDDPKRVEMTAKIAELQAILSQEQSR